VKTRARLLPVAAALAIGGAGCGFLDGLLGDADITDQELCDKLNDVAAQHAKCDGQSAQSVCGGASAVTCIRGNAKSCAGDELDKALDCLFRAHTCSELPASSEGEGEGEGEGAGGIADVHGFCASEIAALTTCANLQNGCGGASSTKPDTACGDSVCGPNESASCPQDCSGGGCSGGTPDGICQAGENSVGCPNDCSNPCNHDGTCDSINGTVESAQCDDCAHSCPATADGCNAQSATCPVCAGCPNDPTSCNVASASCPICSVQCPANASGCNPHTSFCAVCQSSGCNGNSICEAGEGATCADCSNSDIGTCSIDSLCAGGEDDLCGDCTRACESDGDCAGLGGSPICEAFYKMACTSGIPGDCPSTEPKRTSICVPSCARSADCGQFFRDNSSDEGQRVMCVPEFDGRGGCEHAACHSQAECAGNLCVAPSEMVVGETDVTDGSNIGGVCLHACDALNPGACPAPLNHCATVRDDTSQVTGFACTVPGTIGQGGACSVEVSCAPGLTCFNGSCTAFCNNVGGTCANPVGTSCTALFGTTGVCTP
jgi:hypothetical protein